MYKQKHILVIDDDKKLGNLLKSFLTEKGYLVDFVENTLIAKEKLFNIISVLNLGLAPKTVDGLKKITLKFFDFILDK